MLHNSQRWGSNNKFQCTTPKKTSRCQKTYNIYSYPQQFVGWLLISSHILKCSPPTIDGMLKVEMCDSPNSALKCLQTLKGGKTTNSELVFKQDGHLQMGVDSSHKVNILVISLLYIFGSTKSTPKIWDWNFILLKASFLVCSLGLNILSKFVGRRRRAKMWFNWQRDGPIKT